MNRFYRRLREGSHMNFPEIFSGVQFLTQAMNVKIRLNKFCKGTV